MSIEMVAVASGLAVVGLAMVAKVVVARRLSAAKVRIEARERR